MEEDILGDYEKIKLTTLIRIFKREGIENFVVIRRNKLENLIKEYKNLQQIEQEHKKENGALREIIKELEQNQCTHNIDNECIRKSKVIKMLEEVNIDRNAIKKEIEEAIKEKNKEYHADLLGHLRVNYGMKRVLQQLLEE